MSSDSGLSNLSLHPVLLGDLLGRTLGHASTWVASGVLAAALVAVAVATKETLPLDNRKPFTLATANPFSNIWLLFSNGPGLRGLTLSTACFFTAQSTWSIVFPWRFGVLGWTPEQNSAYKLWLQPPAIAVDQFFVAPFMRWAGNLRCFEWSCLATAVGYYLCKSRTILASIWAAFSPSESGLHSSQDQMPATCQCHVCGQGGSATARLARRCGGTPCSTQRSR